MLLPDHQIITLFLRVPLVGDLESLDGIDEAVEGFKNVALPQIEQELLSQAQARALAQEKKTAADT
jgi:hypothetical protein